MLNSLVKLIFLNLSNKLDFYKLYRTEIIKWAVSLSTDPVDQQVEQPKGTMTVFANSNPPAIN